jgi:hypothetical protein
MHVPSLNARKSLSSGARLSQGVATLFMLHSPQPR